MSVFNPLPTFPISGQAVDGDNINQFTWDFQSDSGELQTTYQLIIYSLANAIIYDSGAVSSANEYHDVPASTLTNGVTYKWRVTTNTKTSSAQVFSAITTPVVAVDALPSPFIHQFYTFTGTYAQAEGVLVKEFEWFLYDSSDVLLRRSGVIIGQDIEYQFDDMVDGTTYKVNFTTRNQAEIVATSAKLTFTPDYTMPFDPDIFIVTPDDITGVNKLDWSAVVTQIGNVVGTYQFITPGVWGYALHLDSGSYLNYNLDIDLPQLFTSEMFLLLDSNYNGSFFRFYKNGVLLYEIGYLQLTQKFYYKRGNRFTSGMPVTLPITPFLFAIKPTHIEYQIGGVEYTVR